MKKILTLIAAVTIALTGFSQGKSGGKGQGKQKHAKHVKKQKKSNDNDRYDRDEDRRYDQQRNTTGKYSKNTPAKVREAFQRDFPNATNVTWTKDRGYWTATFGGGIFGGANTATYKANGTRTDASVATNRRTTTTRRNPDGTTTKPTTRPKNGTIWERMRTPRS